MTKPIFLAAALALAGTAAFAKDGNMSFFLTSQNPGDGGNFGGLAGADAHCTALAKAAGHGGKEWHAYLSTDAENARDRIGSGPWMNAAGISIDDSVDALHSENNLNKETALNENGEIVNGRGDSPNRHDILTGSTPEGMVAAGMTCEDWTSAGAETAGKVGHHDRMGLDAAPPSLSWNS